jgi:hypothetical protein
MQFSDFPGVDSLLAILIIDIAPTKKHADEPLFLFNGAQSTAHYNSWSVAIRPGGNPGDQSTGREYHSTSYFEGWASK